MLELSFKPESGEFKLATSEYQEIWNKESAAILAAFEEVTGLKFRQKIIEVIIHEGPSSSGNLNFPMKLRASYPHQIKRGTLVHELGHRLIAPLHNRLDAIDEHQHLNLFLYDVWVKLYGREFADDMVSVESKRKGLYNYENAWKWFLELSPEEKSSILNKFVDLNADLGLGSKLESSM